MMECFSYLGVVELEEGLEVADEVGVNALQWFEQRHSSQFAVRLLIAALLIEMQAAAEEKQWAWDMPTYRRGRAALLEGTSVY